jgi:integrase
VKHLTVEQIEALVKAANDTVRSAAPDRERLCERNRLMFLMCYEHGLRISECLSLTRAHVRRGYLSIKAKKKGKRADERVNPATLELWERVTANLAPHTLIFPISRQFASEIFHRGCDAAGIQLQLRQGIHSLRHSLGHHLLDSGASLPIVQKALRHRSLSSTGVYLEQDAKDVDAWRARATAPTSGTYVAAQPLSLAAIQAEMKRLAELAATMQAPEPTDSAAEVQ